MFQLTPTGTEWSEQVLYSFCSQSNCTDGAHPSASLIMDESGDDGAGNLYGTTPSGGANHNNGTVFALNLGTNTNTLTVSNRATAAPR